jgi:uracil-DNA glycosylase family 4
MNEWEKLSHEINNCKKCRLCEERNNTVLGEGPLQCDLMLIGEGPGAEEDKQGIPFVGRAGQLLTKILDSANIKRGKDIYITNVVKCRPPGNRNPQTDELEACFPYLKRQIELVNPKVFLLCGGVSTRYLLKAKQGITKLRGRILSFMGRPAIPIFHPSYLLRNPTNEKGGPKWLTWQDMKLLQEVLQEIREGGEDNEKERA